jgi:hypothetical protein
MVLGIRFWLALTTSLSVKCFNTTTGISQATLRGQL